MGWPEDAGDLSGHGPASIARPPAPPDPAYPFMRAAGEDAAARRRGDRRRGRGGAAQPQHGAALQCRGSASAARSLPGCLRATSMPPPLGGVGRPCALSWAARGLSGRRREGNGGLGEGPVQCAADAREEDLERDAESYQKNHQPPIPREQQARPSPPFFLSSSDCRCPVPRGLSVASGMFSMLKNLNCLA